MSTVHGTAKPSARSRASTNTWVILAATVPPLALGGVHPEAIFAFLLLACGAALFAARTRPRTLPALSWLAAVVWGWTLLQSVPTPVLPDLLAGPVQDRVRQALAGTDVAGAGTLTPTPADGRLELARVLALGLLFAAAGRASWRRVAAAIAATGAAVALLAYIQAATGTHRIYGLYTPTQVDLAQVPYAFGSFVNPNHQAAFLLLALCCALALVRERRYAASRSADAGALGRGQDLALLAGGAAALMAPALVLSLSRGALLAAALVVPPALFLALSSDPRRQRRPRTSLLRVGVVLALLAPLVPLALWRGGEDLLAWSQDPAADRKIQLVVDSLPMLALAPLSGIGPGAFVDLAPSFASHPEPVLATHLESAPLGLVLRWGLVGALVVFGGVWLLVTIARAAGDHRCPTARRVAALGLIGVALQGAADHWWAFAGVAAPACALAGSLAPRTFTPPRPRLWLWGTGLAAALSFALPLGTWSQQFPHRPRRNGEVLAGTPYRDDLALRPLDASLHRTLARRLLVSHPEQARVRARVATQLDPGQVDGWLLQASSAARVGDGAERDRALSRALALLPPHPDPDLVAFVVGLAPDPVRLAANLPADMPAPAFLGLLAGLRPLSPLHALAVAAERARTHPDDPEPAVLEIRIARDLGRLDEALARARELARRLPERAAGPHSVVVILRAQRPASEREIRAELERALADPRLADPSERALVVGSVTPQQAVEQELLEQRARKLLPTLLARPGDREARVRRAKLADRVRALNEAGPRP